MHTFCPPPSYSGHGAERFFWYPAHSFGWNILVAPAPVAVQVSNLWPSGKAVMRTSCILCISRMCDCSSKGHGFVISEQYRHMSSLGLCHSALLTVGKGALFPSRPHQQIVYAVRLQVFAGLSPTFHLFNLISGVPPSTVLELVSCETVFLHLQVGHGS